MIENLELKTRGVERHSCGATTGIAPRFDLIPRGALLRLARRFEHGLAKHGKDNWRKGLADRDYVLYRLAHVIDHAMKLKEKLEGRLPWDGDDDSAAIMWGGMFLCEATERLEEKMDQ